MRKCSLVTLLVTMALTVACGGADDGATTPDAESSTSTLAATVTPTAPTTTATAEPTPTPLSSRRVTPQRQTLLAAVENTALAPSYRYDYQVEISRLATLPVNVTSVTIAASGANDPATGSAEMTVDFSNLVAALAEGSSDPEAGAILQAIFGDEPLEFRYLAGVAYLRGPLISAVLDVPTNWVSFPAELDESAQSLGSLGFGDFNSQEEILSFLTEIYGVETVGTEEIRGVATTHYSGVISLATLLTLSDPDKAAQIESDLSIQLEDHLGDAPLDVWIDADGIIRRVVLATDFSDFGGVGRYAEEAVGAVTLTYEIYDVGEPIYIEYPPFDDITPVDDTFLSGVAIPTS